MKKNLLGFVLAVSVGITSFASAANMVTVPDAGVTVKKLWMSKL